MAAWLKKLLLTIGLNTKYFERLRASVQGILKRTRQVRIVKKTIALSLLIAHAALQIPEMLLELM
jgi:hypothetical protein